MNDLTISNIERQNVLNNNYALQAIQENLDVNGLHFHDQLLFTTKMVADFYGVDDRTIKRYVQEHGDELRANGYFLSEGNSLKELKLHFVEDINVPKFARQLGVFGLCTGNYFEDSNKRVALTIGVWFLVHNGYYW